MAQDMDSSLGTSPLTRDQFKPFADLADLNRAAISPDLHPDKPGQFNDQGASLPPRFEQVGDSVDLDRAIQVQQDADSTTVDSAPQHISVQPEGSTTHSTPNIPVD